MRTWKRFYDSTLYNFITNFLLKISTNLIRQEVLRTLIRSYIRKEYNRLDNRCKTILISISGRNMFDESFTFHSFKIDRKGSKAEHTKSTETDISGCIIVCFSFIKPVLAIGL